MDFRTLLNKIDNVHSESAEEVSTVEAKKEQTQKQYTSVNDVISDLNKAVFAEPSKSQIKYSSANIQKWTDPRAEVSFKMDELALRIKNNDDLSLFLNKVATLVGDSSKQLSPALQQVVKAVMDKHKDLPMEKDPESEIPYKDPGQDEFEDIQKEDEKDSDPDQSANPADANDNIDDNPGGGTTIKSMSDQDADTKLDSKALSALRLVMDDPQRAVLAKRAIEMIMQGKPLQRLQINAFADAMQKMMAPFLSPAGVTKLKALSKTMPEDVNEADLDRSNITYDEVLPFVKMTYKQLLNDIQRTRKEIDQYKANGDDGEEGGDIYEIKPYLRDLKDMQVYVKNILDNPGMDIETVVDQMMPAGMDTSPREELMSRFKKSFAKDPQLAKRLFKDPELDFHSEDVNVTEGGVKRALEADAESMSREEFIEKHGDAEFFDEYNGVGENWFQGLTDVTLNGDEFYETFGWIEENDEHVEEAEYQGRKVKLSKPMRGDVKKFKVYVKNPKGNVVKVNFGDPDMRIKKSNPARRKSFRARHNCDSPGPKHKARYWSCKKW